MKNKFDETEFLGKFENAVKSHLVSDVPVGVTLSGGMDSGSIAAIASSYKKLKNQLKAFSTIPPYTTNEKKWIDDMVKTFNLDHQYLQINLNKMDETINDILSFHDEPFLSSNCIYQFLLRKKLKKVMLKYC